MPYQIFTYSNEITVQDLLIDSENNIKIIKNKQFRNLQNLIEIMKPEKFYPVKNLEQKELLISIKNSGIIQEIKFNRNKSQFKIIRNEK